MNWCAAPGLLELLGLGVTYIFTFAAGGVVVFVALMRLAGVKRFRMWFRDEPTS